MDFLSNFRFVRSYGFFFRFLSVVSSINWDAINEDPLFRIFIFYDFNLFRTRLRFHL